MKRVIPLAAAALLIVASMTGGCGKGGGTAAKPKSNAPADQLQIKDEATGTGDQARLDDYVTAEYTAWLYTNGARGDKFASSQDDGMPMTIRLRDDDPWPQGQIALGIEGMKVGGKRSFVVPPNPTPGQGGAARVPAGSGLMFEIALLSVPRVQQQDLIVGSGPEAQTGDVIDVHYTGWLSENGAKGKKFESSLDAGQPLHFPLGVGRMIPGWDVGLVGMRVGGKRQLVIPPELAYGTRGAGGVIPPNATLIFEVQLLQIQGKQ